MESLDARGADESAPLEQARGIVPVRPPASESLGATSTLPYNLGNRDSGDGFVPADSRTRALEPEPRDVARPEACVEPRRPTAFPGSSPTPKDDDEGLDRVLPAVKLHPPSGRSDR
jgi:hypothetical protein